MSTIDKQFKKIDRILSTDLGGLSISERREKYKSELQSVVLSILKESYPSEVRSKIVFFQKALKSMIGFYGSETLLLNLLLEEDSAYIVNSLGLSFFEDIRLSNAPQVLIEYLDFIIVQFENKGEYNVKDERLFTMNFFKTNIPSLIDRDWISNKSMNPLITKYLSWFKKNLNYNNEAIAVDSFVIFTKIWNSTSNFLHPFNNTKAILFYNGINNELTEKLLNSSAGVYVNFINRIEDIRTKLFVDLNYMPLFDDSDSYAYSSGYLDLRKKNQGLLKEANEIESISSSWSYTEIIKYAVESSQDYAIKKCLAKLLKRIKELNYPTEAELVQISNLQSNSKANILKSTLINKLYLY
jgi:hypothetical protein